MSGRGKRITQSQLKHQPTFTTRQGNTNHPWRRDWRESLRENEQILRTGSPGKEREK